MAEATGFDVEFAKKPDPLLHTDCGICKLVLCNPCETTCCAVYFCRACIEKSQRYKPSCPNCRRKLGWHVSQAQERFINQLKVICKHNAEGCEWVGELRHLKGHLNENPLGDQDTGCEFVLLKCPRCSEDVKRADLRIHQAKKCPYRDVECPNREKGCSWMGQHESIAEHLNLNSESRHSEGCGFIELSCSYECGQSTERRELKEHETTCPFRLVDCEFKDLGCAARVSHKDMQTHVSIDHMKMLFQTSISLEQAIKTLEKKGLKARIEALERRTEIQALRSSVHREREEMKEQSAKLTKRQSRLIFAAAILTLLFGVLLGALMAGFQPDSSTVPVKPLTLPANLTIRNVTGYNELKSWLSQPLTWPDQDFIFLLEAYTEVFDGPFMKCCVRFRTSSQQHYLLKANITVQIVGYQSLNQRTIHADFDKWASLDELFNDYSCFELPEAQKHHQLHIRVLQVEIDNIKYLPDMFAGCEWHKNKAGRTLSPPFTSSRSTFLFELSFLFLPNVTLIVHKLEDKSIDGELTFSFYGVSSGVLNRTGIFKGDKVVLILPYSEFKQWRGGGEICLTFRLSCNKSSEEVSSFWSVLIWVIICSVVYSFA